MAGISDEFIAQLAAGAIAFLIFLLDRWHERRRIRSDATFEMLRTIIFEDGPIYAANLRFAQLCTEGRKFDSDQLDPEDARTVVEILNFFDLIAHSAAKNIIDKDLVIAHLGGRMWNANTIFEGYIKARRVTLERDGLYRPFQDFLRDNQSRITDS